jgi:hypothetical protein
MKTARKKVWNNWWGTAWTLNGAPQGWEILALSNGCYTVNADGLSWMHLTLKEAKKRLEDRLREQVVTHSP